MCKNDIENGFELAKKSEDFVVNGVLKGGVKNGKNTQKNCLKNKEKMCKKCL